jgi:hypothetical protein
MAADRPRARLHVIGAAMLLAIRKEFGKSLDWLLTGKAFVEPKKGSPT